MRIINGHRLSFVICFLLFFFPLQLLYPDNPGGPDLQKQISKKLELAREVQYEHPIKALRIRRGLISLAKMAQDRNILANVYTQVALSYYNLGKYDSSSMYCDTVLAIPELKAGLIAKVSIIRSVCARRLGDFATALTFARKSLEQYRSSGDTAGMMDVRLSLANIYNETGDNEKAMENYFKVLKYTQSVHDSIFEAQVLQSIANVYMDIDDAASASKYFQRGILIFSHFPERIEFGDALNNYGDFLMHEKKYDSALLFFRKALNIYKELDNKPAIGVAYQNIGAAQIKLHRNIPGLSYLRKAFSIFQKAEDYYDLSSVSLDLGKAFSDMGNSDSAKYYLQKSLSISQKSGKTLDRKNALFHLYELHKNEGNYKEALDYYTHYTHFKDSLDNISMKKNLQHLEVKYEAAKKEKELQHIKDQQLTAEAQRRFLFVSLILVFVFMGLIISVLVLKRKKDKQINQQKVLVQEKEKRLIQSELEHHKALEEQINKELELKTKQLATHAMTMMQKNMLMQELRKSLEDLAQKTGEKSSLKQIMRKIEQGLDVDKDWDLFRMYFEQIDDSFFEKLKEINPKLTPNDYKLAALMRLNMNIKEMASVLNISTDSLKNARYRLKKKLNLPNEVKLPVFLRKL